MLRRILTSSARIRWFPLLSSSPSGFRDAPLISTGGWLPRSHGIALPQGVAFREAMALLQHRNALGTSSSTPSSSPGLPLSSSSPPTDPPCQGSSTGRGQGGKLHDLLGLVKSLGRLKLLYSVLGFVLTGLIADESYCLYLACRGDAPIQNTEGGLWIPSANLDTRALLDKDPAGVFYIVVGCPGIGKTTQLCGAARDRGAAIYIDGGAQRSLKAIQAAMDYRSLRLNFMSWMLPKPQSGLQPLTKLSEWVKVFRRKHLVVIVDHIDKLAKEDCLELVSWAKQQADQKRVVVFLVGSEQSISLMANSDATTRGRVVMCYPPSAQETREALSKFISTNSDKYKLDVEECLYLRGTRPIAYRYDDLNRKEEQIMKEFQLKHGKNVRGGRGYSDIDFWFALLVAGSNGLSLVEVKEEAMSQEEYYVPDIEKVLSEICILFYDSKVYFVSGRSREMHATSLLKVYAKEVKESSAEVERLSTYEKGSAEAKMEKKEKLAREKEKLAKAQERIEKIKECMFNKSYEAYGPRINNQTEGLVEAERV